MTDVLRVVLVVIGVVLALLAAWVVAPEGPIHEVRSALNALKRVFGREQVQGATVYATTATGWATASGSAHADNWSADDPHDRQLRVLHDQVVELRKRIATTDERIRNDLGRRIDTVAADLRTLTGTVEDHWAKYQENEERSSQLDATGVLPAVFGVVLGAASEPLAKVTWIGIVFAVVGVVLAVRCMVVLRTHLRQRRSLTTGAGTTATS